ncbi:MAG: hypothetical protein HQ579_06830 [Candidatus Omnitrophica bacterium]|nr:hypothetical protein [Candidatus Omnitrophota bacterium]
MKFLIVLLTVLLIANNALFAEEIRSGEEEGYTEEIGGQSYRYDEEGSYKGYEQKSGDQSRYYDDQGSCQGEAADTGGDYKFLDKE